MKIRNESEDRIREIKEMMYPTWSADIYGHANCISTESSDSDMHSSSSCLPLTCKIMCASCDSSSLNENFHSNKPKNFVNTSKITDDRLQELLNSKQTNSEEGDWYTEQYKEHGDNKWFGHMLHRDYEERPQHMSVSLNKARQPKIPLVESGSDSSEDAIDV